MGFGLTSMAVRINKKNNILAQTDIYAKEVSESAEPNVSK